jgi:dipeptidyl aminopeptidase/acylaminoacyl peptidase
MLNAARHDSEPIFDLYPQLKHRRMGQVEIVRWKNHRGEALEGSLLLPPNYDGSQRYPLIVDAYPFMGGTDWLDPMMGNQVWASAGYAVFRPSPRAPNSWINPWKASSARLAVKGPQGWAVTLDDVLSGVAHLARRGVADPNRMCLYGFSNGGGVANYLVTQTDQFKCAVSVAAALPDWGRTALLDTGEWSWISTLAGVPLWKDPSLYVKLSSVYYLDRVRTPMLLASGDADGEALLGAIEVYNGLRHAGSDVTLLRYKDQGHGFTGTSLEDFWGREMAFFATHLRPTNPSTELIATVPTETNQD